jgi:hypothetical protein
MFSAVLNNRLTTFSDEFELITNAPAGFRKGFSISNTSLYVLEHTVYNWYIEFWHLLP